MILTTATKVSTTKNDFIVCLEICYICLDSTHFTEQINPQIVPVTMDLRWSLVQNRHPISEVAYAPFGLTSGFDTNAQIHSIFFKYFLWECLWKIRWVPYLQGLYWFYAQFVDRKLSKFWLSSYWSLTNIHLSFCFFTPNNSNYLCRNPKWVLWNSWHTPNGVPHNRTSIGNF